jgi:hypothetical protein
MCGERIGDSAARRVEEFRITEIVRSAWQQMGLWLGDYKAKRLTVIISFLYCGPVVECKQYPTPFGRGRAS